MIRNDGEGEKKGKEGEGRYNAWWYSAVEGNGSGFGGLTTTGKMKRSDRMGRGRGRCDGRGHNEVEGKGNGCNGKTKTGGRRRNDRMGRGRCA